MLTLHVDGLKDLWDEESERFYSLKPVDLQLEHSLISISKWEAKWHKSFIDTNDKTDEEALDYIRCMTIGPKVDDRVYENLSLENQRTIEEYINDPMTATVINTLPTSSDQGSAGKKKEKVTSELIYYWMIKIGIPVEFEKWPINRLLKLIELFQAKDGTGVEKIDKAARAKDYAAINGARKKAWKTKG